KILAKSLQPKVEDRYLDVVDFIGDLSAYLNSENLLKEQKGGEQFSEIPEQLQQVQSSLISQGAPKWSGMEIGIVNYKGMSIAGVYNDFFELPDGRFALVLAESSVKGVGGVVYTAVLRGMVRSLARLAGKPAELISLLNDMI